MGIKTIYKIIKGRRKGRKGKLHNVVTYTDSLEIIEECKDKILGYEIASVVDLNSGEIFDDTFGTDRLRVKEGIVTYNKYFYNTLEDEYYFKNDLDKNVIDILEEDEDCLEIGMWELV